MEGTRREKYRYYNTLACLAKALEGYYTIVDLRNDASLTGKIEVVDGYMNVQMADVTFYNTRGQTYAFESFFVNARSIRYIHIPSNVSSLQLINDELCNNKRKLIPNTKRTLKQKRAQQYQQQTLQELSKK